MFLVVQADNSHTKKNSFLVLKNVRKSTSATSKAQYHNSIYILIVRTPWLEKNGSDEGERKI